VADESQDIFGKIDAILGKRAGFAGGQAGSDEFPVLTEIVATAEAVLPPRSPAGDAMAEVPASTAPASAPEADGEAAAAGLGDMELDRLAAALEARLSELFIRQQMRIEALVRRVVREELEGRRDGREQGPAGL
jgi:hypothetical protein